MAGFHHDQKMKQPMQPLEWAGKVIRFRPNRMVEYLLDHGGMDLNHLARQGFSKADQMQFAQLIGYSVSGYGDLPFVSENSVNKADSKANKLVKKTFPNVG